MEQIKQFKEYNKKLLAIESKPNNNNLVLFAKNVSEKGSNVYFWAQRQDIFNNICFTKYPSYYETIESNNIVKLMIDIDYPLDYKPDSFELNKISDNLSNGVINSINEYLTNHYNIIKDNIEIIILRSKLFKNKISLHIIYNNIIFENIYNLKYFMMQIENKHIDQNIYKIGVFRCFKCCKKGKDNALNLYKTINYQLPENGLDFFLDTLVTYNKYANNPEKFYFINNVMQKLSNVENLNIKTETRGRKSKNNIVNNTPINNNKNNHYYYKIDEQKILMLKQIFENIPINYLNEYYYWILVTFAIKDLYINIKSINTELEDYYKKEVYDIWIKWCKKSEKFNEKKNKIIFDQLNLYKININYVVDIIYFNNLKDKIICGIEYFIKYTDFDTISFNVNLYNTINFDGNDIASNENILAKLDNDIINQKIIAIKSPTGTGKTQFLKTLLKDKINRPILSIVSRVNLAYEQYLALKELAPFKTYREDINSDKLIIQLDSVKWLSSYDVEDLYEEDEQSEESNNLPYLFVKNPNSNSKDSTNVTNVTNNIFTENFFRGTTDDKYLKFKNGIIILDEINSLLEYFRSPTLKNYRKKIFLLFIELLKNASQIICLDADLCDMNMTFLFEILGHKKHVLIYNEYKNRLGIDCKFFESDKRLKLLLIEHIVNKKYFIACFDSKTYMMNLINEVLVFIKENNILDDNGESIENKFKIYACGIGEEMINTEEWENNFVFYTPKVIYGISYTFSQKNVFCFATKDTLNALHLNQQIQRCRNQSNLFIYCHNRKKDRKYENIEDIQNYTNELIKNYILNTAEIREIYTNETIVDPNNECKYYRILYNYTIYFNDILRSHTKEYLTMILKKYGYNIEFINEEEFEIESNDNESTYDSDEDNETSTISKKSKVSNKSFNISDLSSLTFYSGGSQELSNYANNMVNNNNYSKENLINNMNGLKLSNQNNLKKNVKSDKDIIPKNITFVDKKEERRKKIIELFKIDVNNCNDIEKKMLENDDMVTHHLNLRHILKSDDKFNETLIKQEFKELLEERVEQKFTKIKYFRQLMKELGLNSLNDIKIGNKEHYKKTINSEWIINNFDNIKNLFNFRGEKYDKNLLNIEGGYQITYFLLISILKNLCSPEIVITKRTHENKNENKCTEYKINSDYFNGNKIIIDRCTKSKIVNTDNNNTNNNNTNNNNTNNNNTNNNNNSNSFFSNVINQQFNNKNNFNYDLS